MPEKTDAEKAAEVKAAEETKVAEEKAAEAKKAQEATAAEAKKAEDEAAAAKAADDRPVGTDGKPFDPERAHRDLEKAREDAKKAKAKAREAEEKAKKYDELTEQQKTDLEKAQERADTAEAKAKDADAKLRRANLIDALSDSDLNIVNARAAAKLIEGVEYDEDGEPTNLGTPDQGDSLIAQFLTDHDFLRRGKAAKPTPPKLDGKEGDDKKPPELTALELQMAKDSGMDPEEYAAYKKGGSLADLKEAGLLADKQQ